MGWSMAQARTNHRGWHRGLCCCCSRMWAPGYRGDWIGVVSGGPHIRDPVYVSTLTKSGHLQTVWSVAQGCRWPGARRSGRSWWTILQQTGFPKEYQGAFRVYFQDSIHEPSPIGMLWDCWHARADRIARTAWCKLRDFRIPWAGRQWE